MLAPSVSANPLQELILPITAEEKIRLSAKSTLFHIVQSTLGIKYTLTSFLLGVTYVCAIDGYSGMIVGFITIPVKNNVLIILYQQLYRSVILGAAMYNH